MNLFACLSIYLFLSILFSFATKPFFYLFWKAPLTVIQLNPTRRVPAVKAYVSATLEHPALGT